MLGETDRNESESDDIIVRHATREFLGNEVGQKMPPIKSVYVEKSCQGYCVGNMRGKDRNLNRGTYGIPDETLPPHEKMAVHVNYICDSVGSR